MLQAPVPPINYSLRERRKSARSEELLYEEVAAKGSHRMVDVYDDLDDGGKGRTKSRRELPPGAVATLKAWLLSPEHFSHPYPTPQDQAMLMQKTGIDKKQLKNWFTNARRRIWKPMLKKQIESGQLAATGASNGPGGVPGLVLTSLPGAASAGIDNPHSVAAIRVHYQQAVGADDSQQRVAPLDSYGNQLYTSTTHSETSFGEGLAPVPSLGTLPRQTSNIQLSKTDSHAVLMELFARDQDLVRQATESARMKAENKVQPASVSTMQSQGPTVSQHPMKAPVQGNTTPKGASSSLANVPTMNSWPHFSSITSLNNLGTIPGVRSITSLNGQDVSGKGAGIKKGNLAQVKSVESLGKNDSYAFLEVFFGDRNPSSSTNLSVAASKSGKQPEDDNDVGLSLEDESPSQAVSAKAVPSQVSSLQDTTEQGTLKRAYDDALAARGLMSVSRSSENLTDLVLPEKIQRTLSREFINPENKSRIAALALKAQSSGVSGEPAEAVAGASDSSSASIEAPEGSQPHESRYLPKSQN